MSIPRASHIRLIAAITILVLSLGAAVWLALQTWEPLMVPQVVLVAPSPGAADIAPSSQITMTFRNAMDHAATGAAFSILPAITGTLKWVDDRTLVFAPSSALPLSTTITVAIDHTARSQLYRPMSQDFQWSFRTVGPPRVVGSDPAPGARFAYAYKGLAIRFSREMDHASVESHIVVTPPLEAQRLVWNGSELAIAGVIRPGDSFRVTLKKGAQDRKFGVGTEADIVWTVTATSQYPLLALTSGGCCILLRAGRPEQLDLQMINISRVDARLDRYPTEALWGLLFAGGDTTQRPRGSAHSSWSVDPHLNPDQYAHFSLPLDALSPGLYGLTLASQETIPETRFLFVSQTALTVKRGAKSILVWATSLATGQPRSNLPVVLYDERGIKVGEGLTDRQGLYEGTLAVNPSTLYVVSAAQDDFAVTADNWQDGIEPWRWPELAPPLAAAAPPPETPVQVELDRSAYVQGDGIHATITARDSPDSPVQWTLWRTDYAPDAGGAEPDVATPATTEGLRELAIGHGVLDASGRLALSIPPITTGTGSQRVTLQAMVIPPAQAPISGAGSAVVHTARVEIVARPLSSIVSINERSVWQIKTLDIRGETLGMTALDYVVQHLDWNCEVERDDLNRQAYRCKENRTAVASGRLTTGADGRYQLAFTPSRGGGYALVLRGRDARGNRVTDETRLWVTAPDGNVSWPLPEGRRVNLVSDRAVYAPGDLARILILSPYPHATALVTLERENVLWHAVVSLQSNSATVAVPLLDTYAPDVVVSVMLIPSSESASDAPAFRIGYTRLRVVAEASKSNSAFELGVTSGSGLALPR